MHSAMEHVRIFWFPALDAVFFTTAAKDVARTQLPEDKLAAHCHADQD
jgi:hypothetical protein